MQLKFIAMILSLALFAAAFAQTAEQAKTKSTQPAKPSGGKITMAESTEFSISKVGQISVRAKDIERATVFYRDTLGLKHLFKTSNISFFDCGGVNLFITIPENAELDHPSSIIYFDVEDIQKAFKTLSERGVKFEEKPNVVGQLGNLDVWIAIFRDSENNLMGLRSMVAKK